MQGLRNALELARQSLALQLSGRSFWLILVLACASSFVFLLIPPNPGRVFGDELFRTACVAWVLSFLHPLATLFFATQVVHADLADRTATYLFVRPVSRLWVLAGKLLAVVLMSWVVMLVGTGSLFGVIAWCGREWKGDVVPLDIDLLLMVQVGLMTSLAYSAVGTLFAAWFRRPMIWGTVFLVGWEIAVSRLPPKAGLRTATVSDAFRRWVAIEVDPQGKVERAFLLDRLRKLDDVALLGDPVMALVKFTLVALGLAAFIYWYREYDSRPAE